MLSYPYTDDLKLAPRGTSSVTSNRFGGTMIGRGRLRRSARFIFNGESRLALRLRGSQFDRVCLGKPGSISALSRHV